MKRRMAKGPTRSERGYSLIGIMVAITILGLIIGCLASTLTLITDVHDRASAEFPALQNAQSLGNWLAHDIHMATSVSTEDIEATAETEVLTLSWVGWPREDHFDNLYYDTYVVSYRFDSGVVTRQETVTTEQYDDLGRLVLTTSSQASTFIADSITSLSITVQPSAITSGNEVICTITSQVEEVTVTREYRAAQRAS